MAGGLYDKAKDYIKEKNVDDTIPKSIKSIDEGRGSTLDAINTYSRAGDEGIPVKRVKQGVWGGIPEHMVGGSNPKELKDIAKKLRQPKISKERGGN